MNSNILPPSWYALVVKGASCCSNISLGGFRISAMKSSLSPSKPSKPSKASRAWPYSSSGLKTTSPPELRGTGAQMSGNRVN